MRAPPYHSDPVAERFRIEGERRAFLKGPIGRIRGRVHRCCASLGRVSLTGRFERLRTETAGSTIIIFGLTLPVLLLTVGAAVDYGHLSVERGRLQASADAAALAAASELHIVTADQEQAKAVAQQVAVANAGKMSGKITVTTLVTAEPPSVSVTITEDAKLYFAGIFGSYPNVRISARATARVVGSTRICVLALDEKASGAISAETKSRLTGNGCAVFSNSTSSQGVVAKNSAVMEADLICSAGGANGGADSFEPAPLTDCPKIPDPLADRPPPPIGSCDANWLLIEEDVTLSPGVYCGGIEVSVGVRVTFSPGVYIIKDGALIVDDDGELVGENVGFYLTGKKALFKFTPLSSISLTAPKDGPLAGLLFFEDSNRKTAGTHYINSNNARLLLGTIYLPASDLVVDANAPIADQSAYTAIVVRSLKLYEGPHLVLNTDYGATDIPVPDGIKGSGNAVALTE